MKGDIYNKKYYNAVNSGGYTDGYQPSKYKPIFDDLAKYVIEKFKPKSVLDVGCARGYLVKSFIDLGINAYGIDISAYAINNSLSEVREKLRVCDIEEENLPFNDNTFDVIIMTEVIEHLKRYDVAIQEIKRVLKSDGIVYLTTPTPREKHHDPTHINIHDKDFWSNFFHRSGLYYEFLPYIESVGINEIREMLKPDNNRILRSKIGKVMIKFLSINLLYKLNNFILRLSFAIKCSELDSIRIIVILRNKK